MDSRGGWTGRDAYRTTDVTPIEADLHCPSAGPSDGRLHLSIDDRERRPLCRRRRRNYLSDAGKADRTKWTWRLSRSPADRCRGLRGWARRPANLYMSSQLFCYLVDGR